MSVAGSAPRGVDQVLSAYVEALGGARALDAVTTREVRGSRHHGAPLTYFWQKPEKVLLITKKEKIGYDGNIGWDSLRKRKAKHFGGGAQIPLEIDANPLRFAHLKDLYSEVDPAPAETLDGTSMDVLVAPNNLGATKFYFNSATHLLERVEETGETSAYYKQVVEFMGYKPVDGLQFPFRIVHTTTEPGGDNEDFRVGKVMPNVSLNPQIFTKPIASYTITGGKR